MDFLKDGRIVAIKELSLKTGETTKKLYERERGILTQLEHHENLVSFLDSVDTERFIYFVIEYCNSGDLHSYLGNHDHLSGDDDGLTFYNAKKVWDERKNNCEEPIMDFSFTTDPVLKELLKKTLKRNVSSRVTLEDFINMILHPTGSNRASEQIFEEERNCLKFPDENTFHRIDPNKRFDEYFVSKGVIRSKEAINNKWQDEIARYTFTENHRKIAIKHVKADTKLTEQEEERLKREYKVFRQANNSANVVELYGVLVYEPNNSLGRLQHEIHICLEFMSYSLHDINLCLKENPQYRDLNNMEKFISAVVKHIFDALKYCADHNIIHRNIRPQSILFNSEKFIAKLGEFSYSRFLDKDSLAHTIDAGFYIYWPPERFQGAIPYDISSDVWALGITMYEFFKGELPYRKDVGQSQFNYVQIKDQILYVAQHTDQVLHQCFGDNCPEAKNFISRMLVERDRPKFDGLMKESYYLRNLTTEKAQKAIKNYLEGEINNLVMGSFPQSYE
uniref:mitogen-activated protein kinase kinase n=1 Tax=Acrobeloides nanus TaxID=290746 RepID=A0A914C2B1_9BILA